MPGAPVPADALLDAIAIVEARQLDDVAGMAALLPNADLRACARVLDSLLAHEMVFMPFFQTCALARALTAGHERNPSPGVTVLALAEALGGLWGEECIADRSFRDWALGMGGRHVR
jgi:hypothetical protein